MSVVNDSQCEDITGHTHPKVERRGKACRGRTATAGRTACKRPRPTSQRRQVNGGELWVHPRTEGQSAHKTGCMSLTHKLREGHKGKPSLRVHLSAAAPRGRGLRPHPSHVVMSRGSKPQACGKVAPLKVELSAYVLRYSGLVLGVSCPSPRVRHFSEEPWFFLLENGGARGREPGSGCVHCCWDGVASRPLRSDVCMC